MLFKPDKEAIHGCSENAHFHDPGAGAFTFIGKGTPAPIDAPVFLVREGPYQWVRNPMYLGVLSVVIGEAILFHSLLLVGYALLAWVVVHLFVIFYEEPTLRRQFGESYAAYLRTVPRWLPRFSPQAVPDRS